MPKNKARNKKQKKQNKENNMKRTNIKRVKRIKKKIRPSEKVLAGLGLGATLLGGASAVIPKTNQTQFVRTQDASKTQSKVKAESGIKKFFKNVWENTLGTPTAKAETIMTPFGPEEVDTGSDTSTAQTTPQVSSDTTASSTGSTTTIMTPFGPEEVSTDSGTTVQGQTTPAQTSATQDTTNTMD